MPLWSVEEWRARIGSSWAALGRPVGCSSHCKQRRHVCCPLSGGGGGMVVSTIPMMTNDTLLMLSMSLIIVLPLEAGSSPLLHSGSRMCYHGNITSVWSCTSHLFLVLWKELFSCSSSSAKQLVCVLLPRDLFVSMNSVQPGSSVYIVSALTIAIVVTMDLETAAAVQASLLLRCGDIELNPGPLGREDLEKVDNSRVLTENDLNDICKEVVGIKSTYYQLGIALGLPAGELDSIRRSFHQVIDQAFYEVLLVWLRQRHDVQRHGPPTWRRLVEVVDSPNGGNNPALAMTIASRHAISGRASQSQPTYQHQPPYQPPCYQPSQPNMAPHEGTNGSANHPYGHSVHPVSQPAGIVPHNTPQYMTGGFQIIGGTTSFPPFYHNPSYNMYHPVSPPGYMVYNQQQGAPFQFGFQQGIPPLHKFSWTPHPGQERDEESEVTLSSKRRKLDPSKHPLGQVPFSTSIAQHIDHWRRKLIDSYLAQECSSDAWPPLKLVQFVQLALVKQDEHADHIGLKTIRKDIDEVYGKKTMIGFSEMFEKIDPSSLILFEGRPGSGKTTLMVKVSCDWARGTILHSMLVVLVRLRYLSKKRDIYLHDLLRVAYGAPSQADIDGLASYIEGRLGEDVVFILDGFDEYAPGASDDNYVSKLILKQVYSRSIVIVSSRPAATQRFRQRTTKWVEVMGFFKDQVVQYITSYFEKRKEKERAKQLIQHLEQHPNLMNLCYLPLHCAMLVFLYEQGNATLPVTETEFYRYFTLSSIFRTISKGTKYIDKLTSFDQLLPKEKSIFYKICNLAFKATIESQQVFKKSEISDICGDVSSMNDKENPGLLVIDRCLATVGYDDTYSFLHLTLQEYLSALYIADRGKSEQESIITSHTNKSHLYVVWRFLFGILDYSKESTVNLFKQILDATRGNNLFHIQCAYESHHSAACTDVLHFHENNLEFYSIGPFDLVCITYVLKTAEYTIIKLNFKRCNFSVDDAVALLKGVGDHQVSLAVYGGEAVQSALDALSLVTVPGLIELILDGGGGASVSVKNNLKLSANLQTLKLFRFDITNLGLEEGFKHWPNLEELHIVGTSCPLTVLEAIKHCTNLVKLILCRCNLDDSKAQVLGESLKCTSKLHTISLVENNLTDESIPCLTELIKSARNLEELNLQFNQFTPEGKEQIEEAVRERNSVGVMTELELYIVL